MTKFKTDTLEILIKIIGYVMLVYCKPLGWLNKLGRTLNHKKMILLIDAMDNMTDVQKTNMKAAYIALYDLASMPPSMHGGAQ